MKAFWKILGLGALAVGLTPYKVEKNEETGENSYQALLWRITVGPGSGNDKKNIDIDLGINLGEGTLTSKLMGGEKAEEPHLFSDELSVEYTAPVTEAVEEEVAAVTEEAAEEAVEAVEAEEAPQAPEVPETPEAPEEPEAEETKAE